MYLKCDVLVLADVLKKLRNNGFKTYELCPSHYLIAPAFSWDAVLNMTKLKFFEKGMRRGVSYISNTYSKANNEYLKYFDSKQELKHFIYLDANKLYCYGMFKFISTSGLT